MCKQEVAESVSEGQDVVNISLKQKSARYFDEFVKLRCAPNLLIHNVFPNAKEITETMAAFNAYRKYFRFINASDPNVSIAVVGDGSTPRTGALFAMRSAWQVWSIDPNMRDKPSWGRIHRLRREKAGISTFKGKQFDLLVLVHAHVQLKEIEGMSSNVICIPCCYEQNYFEGRPADYGIWSPKRNVKIWRKE